MVLCLGIHLGRVIALPRIRFGPAGYPNDANGKLDEVFRILSEGNLSALEYAATYGLRIGEKKGQKLASLANQHDIAMSMHGAYYINLASKKEKTRKRSKARLVKALRFAPLMGVKRIVFHPGTYGGLAPEEAFLVIRDAMREAIEEAGQESGDAVLAPEIAGKKNMFGSPGQIIRLCQEVSTTIPCIDWAHLYARTGGNIGDKDSYSQVLDIFEDALGNTFTDNMHFHVSSIIFNQNGEKAHRPLGAEWGPDILPLIELVLENGYKPTFISETPTPIRGALYTKILCDKLSE
ncbi:MAG: TIM barrel protein [Promethearchaeia archaeon]